MNCGQHWLAARYPNGHKYKIAYEYITIKLLAKYRCNRQGTGLDGPIDVVWSGAAVHWGHRLPVFWYYSIAN